MRDSASFEFPHELSNGVCIFLTNAVTVNGPELDTGLCSEPSTFPEFIRNVPTVVVAQFKEQYGHYPTTKKDCTSFEYCLGEWREERTTAKVKNKLKSSTSISSVQPVNTVRYNAGQGLRRPRFNF